MPGFENWTNGNPDGWQTTNNDQFTNISQSSDAHSASSSVNGTVASVAGFQISPSLETKFPFTDRPSSLTGYYKFTSSGSDSLVIITALYKGDKGIGGGIFKTISSTGSWTQFSLPISYYANDSPDSAAITIMVEPAVNSHTGTSFYMDDLSYSSTTAINETTVQTPNSFELKQNYPNPFNPTTTIEYQVPVQTFVTLKIYNMLGKEVATLVNKNEPTGKYSVNFNASSLSSGVYLYRIKADNYSQAKKLIVLK